MHGRGFLAEEPIVVSAPLGPRLWQVQVHLDGCGKGLVRLFAHAELVEEHALEREELGLLRGGKEHEVGVVDHIQALRQFMRFVVVAPCLFPQFEERFLDLDVGQRIDLGERTDTHVAEAVLPSDVREAVDDPCRLVVAAVRVRIRRRAGAFVPLDQRDERQVRLVHAGKHMLSPRHEVTPRIDVVPQVRQPLAPRLHERLELDGAVIQVRRIRVCERRKHRTDFLQLDELLEDLQERNVRLGHVRRKCVPLVQSELDRLVTDASEIGRLVGRCLRLEQGEVRLKHLAARCAHDLQAFERTLERLALRRPVREAPGALEGQVVVVLEAREICHQVPLLQLESREDPVVVPQLVLGLRQRQARRASLDLRSLVQQLRLGKAPTLFVRERRVRLGEHAPPAPQSVEVVRLAQLRIRLSEGVLRRLTHRIVGTQRVQLLLQLLHRNVPRLERLAEVLEHVGRHFQGRDTRQRTTQQRLHDIGPRGCLLEQVLMRRACDQRVIQVELQPLGRRAPYGREERLPQRVGSVRVGILQCAHRRHKRRSRAVPHHLRKGMVAFVRRADERRRRIDGRQDEIQHLVQPVVLGHPRPVLVAQQVEDARWDGPRQGRVKEREELASHGDVRTATAHQESRLETRGELGAGERRILVDRENQS